MVGLTMRLFQLFHTIRRPLNLLGHQCLRFIDNSYSHPCLASESVHHSELSFVVINLPRGCCSYLHPHPSSVTISHFGFMTRAWGIPASFVHIFFFLPRERFGSHIFPSPSSGSLLQFLSSFFLTMVLSTKETFMYFGYTYAPNLTHQRAFFITETLPTTLHTNG
jgi:hypothetical protein